jgi:Flp pilus assembly protein TadG
MGGTRTIGTRRSQRGSVLLLVTFSLVVLFGLAALVLDIGRLYIVKGQLQNAADAGALRAALALDTGAGLSAARDKGAEAALKNAYLLVANALQDNGIDIVIEVAMSPDTPPEDWVAASGTRNPNGYYFAKATTRKSGIPTFFAGMVGILDKNNGASAVAVAGRYHIDIMPLAICAPNLSDCPGNKAGGTCGLQPGLSYAVSTVNPLGPGNWYWIDPEASGPNCKGCKYGSADSMRPYLCAGKAGPAVSGMTGSTVCTNTGKSVGPALGAIDSRFGDYPSQSQCTPEAGPPDTNVMEYLCDGNASGAGKECPKTAKTKQMIADWMKPNETVIDPITNGPIQVTSNSGTALDQTALVEAPGGDPQPPPMTLRTDGVAWSFVDPSGNAFKTTRDVKTTYPTETPYKTYLAAPEGAGYAYRKAGRRILDMLIVKCHTAGGTCRDAEVQAIGEFLLTRKASDNNEMYVEFGRIVPISEFMTEIRLYQ